MGKAKRLATRWAEDTYVFGTNGKPTYEKPLEIEMAQEETSTAKSFDEIRKFNPYHGAHGYFSTANAATSMTYKPGASRAHDKAIEREKQRAAADSSKETTAPVNPKLVPFLKGYAKGHGNFYRAVEISQEIAETGDYKKSRDEFINHFGDTNLGIYEGQAKKTKMVIQEIGKSQTSKELYRIELAEKGGAPSPGDTITWGIRSTSTSSQFIDKCIGGAENNLQQFARNGKDAIVYHIKGRKNALDMAGISPFDFQQEHLVYGKFKTINISEPEIINGRKVTHVTIEQIPEE